MKRAIMRRHRMKTPRYPFFLTLSLSLLFTSLVLPSELKGEAGERDPAELMATPGALRNPMELPLAASRTSTVYRAEEGGWTFNLHSYVARFEDRFWAVWSSGRTHEDSAGQVVRYANSVDGHRWSESRVLTEPVFVGGVPGTCIARGVFVHQGELTALAAFFDGRGSGLEWKNLRLIRFTWDGSGWVSRGIFIEDCMNNYPPRPIGDRLFLTCRMGPLRRMHTVLAKPGKKNDLWRYTPIPKGQTNPASTDARRTWAKGNRLSEPSWYVDPQGIVHLIFRDGGRSRYLFHSISTDRGATWSPPVMTDYPDAVSKNYTGRLSSGFYYLINNPALKRDPLAISFSSDGWKFGGTMLLRKNAPSMRYAGRFKSDGSFQYPHAIEHDGSLWVVYSTNKEDIEISEYSLGDFTSPEGNLEP